MTKSRGILNPRKIWTDAEVAWLVDQYPDRPSDEIAKHLGVSLHIVYRKARSIGLKKSEAFMASPAACRLRRGDEVGKAYRFPKGHIPANKGLRQPGFAPGRMAETQFKKGRINTGSKAEMPLGTERVNSDGYLVRKIRMDLRGAQRWESVHRLNWIAANGPIPAGHSLAFRDGNRLNVALDNLELISNQEKMRRNSIYNLPPEVVVVVKLRGAITRQINKRSKA